MKAASTPGHLLPPPQHGNLRDWQPWCAPGVSHTPDHSRPYRYCCSLSVLILSVNRMAGRRVGVVPRQPGIRFR